MVPNFKIQLPLTNWEAFLILIFRCNNNQTISGTDRFGRHLFFHLGKVVGRKQLTVSVTVSGYNEKYPNQLKYN